MESRKSDRFQRLLFKFTTATLRAALSVPARHNSVRAATAGHDVAVVVRIIPLDVLQNCRTDQNVSSISSAGFP